MTNVGFDDVTVWSQASTYNGLAICLKSQGKYDEALETHKKALAIKLQVLGPDDADVALTYHGMGVVVDYQDKFDEANTLYRKGLAIRCVLVNVCVAACCESCDWCTLCSHRIYIYTHTSNTQS